jgi:hypothetical protein
MNTARLAALSLPKCHTSSLEENLSAELIAGKASEYFSASLGLQRCHSQTGSPTTWRVAS